MKEYTITEIAHLSKLSLKDVKRHLIAQTLRNQALPNGHKIIEEDLNQWLEGEKQYDLEKIKSDLIVLMTHTLRKRRLC